MNRIDEIYEREKKGFIGRYSHYYEDRKLEVGRWERIMRKNGVSCAPYFNAEFAIFKNVSQNLTKKKTEK